MTTISTRKILAIVRTGIPALLLAMTFNASAQSPAPGAPVAPVAPAAPAAPSTAVAPDATGFSIKFKVKPGKNAEFEKAVADLMAGVRAKEPRNLYCDLFHLSQDGQTYVILERYRDVAAVKEHSESEHIKKIGAALKNDLLDAPPEVLELVYIRSK